MSITTPQNDTLVGAPFNKKFKSIDSANFEPINSEEDFFKPVTEEWRRKAIQEILNIKIHMERTTFIPINTYRNLKSCVHKKKISIYPDGNCLYRALSWWVTERKDYHECIRAKIVEFMRESLTCQQYVKTKSNKNIDEYIRQNNIMSSTVWGSDVEIPPKLKSNCSFRGASPNFGRAPPYRLLK